MLLFSRVLCFYSSSTETEELVHLFNVPIFHSFSFQTSPCSRIQRQGMYIPSFSLLPLQSLEQIHISWSSGVDLKFSCLCIFQATKIHQRAFGNDHPITARSLELMATVYAEIGKTEYSGKHPTMGRSDTG